MIIEITGPPGAGKTTLLRQVCSSGENDDLLLYSDDFVLEHYKINFISSNPLRKIVANMLLIFIFLPHCIQYGTFLRFTVAILKKRDENFMIKLSRLRNIILKLGRFHFIDRNFRRKTVLVDEGISHIPFIILYTSNKKKADLKLLFAPLSAVISRIKVIVLDSRAIDIKYRYQALNHRDYNNKFKEMLDWFISSNNQLIEAYRSNSTGQFKDLRLLRLGAGNDKEAFLRAINSDEFAKSQKMGTVPE